MNSYACSHVKSRSARSDSASGSLAGLFPGHGGRRRASKTRQCEVGLGGGHKDTVEDYSGLLYEV